MAEWLVGLLVIVLLFGLLYFFFFNILLSVHGCAVWFLPPASPRLAVNSAHFEIRRLGYSSLEMLLIA